MHEFRRSLLPRFRNKCRSKAKGRKQKQKPKAKVGPSEDEEQKQKQMQKTKQLPRPKASDQGTSTEGACLKKIKTRAQPSGRKVSKLRRKSSDHEATTEGPQSKKLKKGAQGSPEGNVLIDQPRRRLLSKVLTLLHSK